MIISSPCLLSPPRCVLGGHRITLPLGKYIVSLLQLSLCDLEEAGIDNEMFSTPSLKQE